MLSLSCLCGRIRIDLQKRPDFINECNCAACGKSGAGWGYFHPSEVSVRGPTQGYCRSDKDDPNAWFHFCPTCGSTTHFALTDSAVAKFGNLVGVNMWLAEAGDLAGIELRFPDGRSWSGQGAVRYVREPRIIVADD
jgi:hypothetical protein